MASPDLVAELAPHLERFPMGIGPRWAEYWRHRATEYLMGQVLPGARKSMEPMAARLSDVAYHEMQQFITNSPWDWEETQGGLIDVGRTDVGTADALIPIDDTAFVKQGDDSVGVARQYCGILGKVANCQVAVTMVYLVPDPARNADGGVFPLGIRLFLPEEWADDPGRRRRARIPSWVKHREKWRIALELVDLVRGRRLPHRAYTFDAGYGNSREFRAELRHRGESYVAGVDPASLYVVQEAMQLRELPPPSGGPPGSRLRFPAGKRGRSARDMAQELPPSAWHKVAWTEGTKGELKGWFARVRVRVTKKAQPTKEVGWLLFERRDDVLKAYLCHGFDTASLEELVRVARGRWAIEQFHRETKDELGLDHFEGRRWTGWYHHTTLTLLAYSFLATKRWQQRSERPEKPLPTLPEIRRGVVEHVVERLLGEAITSAGDEKGRNAARRLSALLTKAG